MKKELDGTDAGWPGYGAGTGASQAVQSAMEEAYIQSGWYNDSFDGPYNLGFPAAKAQQEGDICYQEFFGNDSTGASPQLSRNGAYGISYLITSASHPDQTYIVTDKIFTAWASTWQNVNASSIDRFSQIGAPVSNQSTDGDGNTIQEFEKARIQVSADGTAQILYNEGRFEMLALTGGAQLQNALIDGRNIAILAKEGADLTQTALDYTLCAGAACDIPSGTVKDFSAPVDFTVTSYNGTKTVYTVTVLTPSSIPEEERTAAEKAEEAIAALPNVVYLNHKEQVDAACAAYDALSATGKLLIPGDAVADLNNAVDRIQTLGRPIRITCVGDSITEGIGGSAGKSYPDQMQALLGDGYEVFNAGVSGTNVLKRWGDVGQGTTYPYWITSRYTQGKEFQPDIAIIMLGTNDATNRNWLQSGYENVKEAFKEDYRALIQEYKALDSKPYIFLALPMTCYGSGNADRMQNLKESIIPVIQELAQEENLELIDMHSFTADHADWFPDTLHPGNTSYGYVAAEFAKYVTDYAEKAAEYRLTDLQLDGVTIEGFDPSLTEYTVKLEQGQEIPQITAAASFEGATVEIVDQPDKASAFVQVTSADGRYQQVYAITFQGGAVIVPGDMDKDGVVTIQDVMEACKVLARKSAGKEPTAEEMQRGNLDGDDAFTINDVMEICKILARKA